MAGMCHHTQDWKIENKGRLIKCRSKQATGGPGSWSLNQSHDHQIVAMRPDDMQQPQGGTHIDTSRRHTLAPSRKAYQVKVDLIALLQGLLEAMWIGGRCDVSLSAQSLDSTPHGPGHVFGSLHPLLLQPLHLPHALCHTNASLTLCKHTVVVDRSCSFRPLHNRMQNV